MYEKWFSVYQKISTCKVFEKNLISNNSFDINGIKIDETNHININEKLKKSRSQEIIVEK